MKRFLSVFLVLMLVVTSVAVFTTTTSAAEGFRPGDVLYLRIENPADWAEGATLYANFTSYSRADNDDSSVTIASADKSRYNPSTGLAYDSAKGVYSYTVTAADAGASSMRFWRGNDEKLWNSTVLLTAADYAEGNNTVVVTDWTDTGYLGATYDTSMTASISLSASGGDVGDSFDISVTNSAVSGADISYEVYINDDKVSDTSRYTFTPSANGAYAVSAVVTATVGDRVVAKANASSSITVGTAAVTAARANTLYAHASSGTDDGEAWIAWYRVDDIYYFFLPSSIREGDPVELYSSFISDARLDTVSIPSSSLALMTPDSSTTYTFSGGGLSSPRSVRFMFSTAEAALFVNNTDDFSGFDFFTYLTFDKSNSVSASGAIVDSAGALEAVDVKKMKGRGNTSWNADKKGFNITLQNAISLDGMEKCKKFSLISNFQDAAMARNRILFDLSDEIGVPYASDSRFIDLYTNGTYQGAYQMCQKIDVGKNTLMPDIDEEDYLDAETGGVKSDFSFVCEIDSSPAADDFTVSASNGNNLTMKSPELDSSDPNYNAVRGYIRGRYNTMYQKLTGRAADVDDYIDLTSLAKVYLINELGKNWDSGATSFFLTYKPDSNGAYKFFASPVWDYDNSLGNANGIASDLSRMGCTDYTLPSGWFSTKKGGYTGPNFLSNAVKNPYLMEEVYRVWFEDFVPALETLTSTGISSGELFSADVYYSRLTGSAAMNYRIWELYTNTEWIADHSSIRRYRASYTKNAYDRITGVTVTQDDAATAYDQYTFKGQFDYMMDWTTSRAAWISSQYIASYTPTEPDPTEPDPTEPDPTEPDPTEPVILPYPAPSLDMTHVLAAWVFDDAAKVEGEKLTEYGSSSGYAATRGDGTLTMSVDGENLRALEWSAAEYGPSGTSMVPIMAAGSKNLWGAPYILLNLSTGGYEDIRLTMYLAGSNKAPASWKLQYSADGEDFTDISGAEFTITSAKRKLLTAYFSKKLLPAEVTDLDSLYLRLVPVSMTTVSGGDTSEKPSGGEIALNYIVVSGIDNDSSGDILGDVNLNDTVDILDATFIQRHLANLDTLSERQKAVANVNRNDDVDILDATLIQRYLANLISEF